MKKYLSSFCHEGKPNCVECIFENDFQAYSRIVAKYGVDWEDKSMKEWISEKA